MINPISFTKNNDQITTINNLTTSYNANQQNFAFCYSFSRYIFL